MGLFTSRGATSRDVVDASNGGAYKYPPKSGNYFGNYFIMGGTRFESTQPESYLFGENKDLNFLGSKPTPFPYPTPQAHEPTRTLKSLVNIRKDSLKFVKEDVEETEESVEDEPRNTRYNIEFAFDTDVKCAITIYYFATEEIINKALVYKPKDEEMSSETFHYKKGANQVFCQPTHFISPCKYLDDEWQFNGEKEVIPIVIHCVVEEEEHVGHSHSTLAIVDKSVNDGSYLLKAFKQKQMVDGLCYLLQEIYGIENKNTERAKVDDDIDDNGSECVICMSETRDTLILPCRHLCLCNGCADNLRYQANNCPICRSKFRALLQLRAIRKKAVATAPDSAASSLNRRPPANTDQTPADEPTPLSQDGVPPGYEAVALIEALNGPTLPHCAVNVSGGKLTSDGTLESLRQKDEAVETDEKGGSKDNTPASSPAASNKKYAGKVKRGSTKSSGKENGGDTKETDDKETYIGSDKDKDSCSSSVEIISEIKTSKSSESTNLNQSDDDESLVAADLRPLDSDIDDTRTGIRLEEVKLRKPLRGVTREPLGQLEVTTVDMCPSPDKDVISDKIDDLPNEDEADEEVVHDKSENSQCDIECKSENNERSDDKKFPTVNV